MSVATLDHHLQNLELDPLPWPHAYLPSSFDEDFVAELVQDFPAHLVGVRNIRQDTDKSYSLRQGRLDGDDDELASSWRALLQYLAEDDYRARMERLIGLSLEDATLELAVWEYAPEDFLGPHVDKADKLITQIFYVGSDWATPDGGRLLILEGPDDEAPARGLLPAPGASAIVRRTETSWHAVEPVRSGRTRRSKISSPPGNEPRSHRRSCCRSWLHNGRGGPMSCGTC